MLATLPVVRLRSGNRVFKEIRNLKFTLGSILREKKRKRKVDQKDLSKIQVLPVFRSMF